MIFDWLCIDRNMHPFRKENMTCIVAIEHNGKVYMGGDSAAVAGWDVTIIEHPKVFFRDDLIIGYTDSFRMGQLLEFNLTVPANHQEDDLTYMIRDFIPAVRECLKSNGFTTVNNNTETGGSFLVGYHGKIYSIYNDFQVTRFSEGFAAIGCGMFYALGALAVLNRTMPRKVIPTALEVAARFSAGVRGPFYVFEGE